MHFRSWLTARAKPGQRDALLHAYVQRRVLQECKDTIDGFLHAQLMVSEQDPDLVCVSVEWRDRQAYDDWQHSPVRAQQLPDLLPWIEGAPQQSLWQVVPAGYP